MLRASLLCVVLLLLVATTARAEGLVWLPCRGEVMVGPAYDYDAITPAQVDVPQRTAILTLEMGAGLGVMSGVQFAANISIGLLDLPASWPILGGERFYLFGGTVGPAKCAGPAISIGTPANGLRLGVPIWTEGGQPRADIAIWQATEFSLF